MAKLHTTEDRGTLGAGGRKAYRKPLSFRIAAFLLFMWLGVITKQRWHNTVALERNFRQTNNTGFIVVANHMTNLDPLLIANLLCRHGVMPHFLAKSSLFEIPVLGCLMRCMQQIPVERGTKRAAEALKTAQRILVRGGSIVVYPEGTHTRDPEGWPMQGRPGAVKLALDTDATVIPLAHYGAQKNTKTRSRWRCWRKRVDIVVGDPIDLSLYQGRDLTSNELRQAANCIMTEVKRLQALLRPEDTPPEQLWSPSSPKDILHHTSGAEEADDRRSGNTADSSEDHES